MKTKTLLIAAAALAAGVMSSQAQVYSQNIVGYVNVACPAGAYQLLSNPLQNGVDNSLTNLFPAIPGASTISVWGGSSYTVYKFSAGHWKNLNAGNAISDSVQLAPGQGFFFAPSAAYTNTFVGSLAVPSGSSITNSLTATVQLVGSKLPFGDAVTNQATLNLQVAGATTISKWDAVNQKFSLYKLTAGSWKLNGTTPSVPQIGVAEGFFITPSSATNWVEVAP